MIVQILVFASTNGESATPWWLYLGYAIAGGIAMRIAKRNSEKRKTYDQAKSKRNILIAIIAVAFTALACLLFSIVDSIREDRKVGKMLSAPQQSKGGTQRRSVSAEKSRPVVAHGAMDMDDVVSLSIELKKAIEARDIKRAKELSSDYRIRKLHILDNALRFVCESTPFDKDKAEFLIACGADVSSLSLEARRQLTSSD